MNWLEMFAIFVISILGYFIVTGLFGSFVASVIENYDGFPWGAWAFGGFIFVVVVLAWAYGLPFPLKR